MLAKPMKMLELHYPTIQFLINLFTIQTRVFYWELNHSQIPYATSSGTRVAYFPYVTFESVVSFNDIRFVSYIVLKFVGVSSKHLRVFLGCLRQSSQILGHLQKFSEIFGKCWGMFVRYSEQFWKIFRNLRKVVGNNRKIIKNAVISMSI